MKNTFLIFLFTAITFSACENDNNCISGEGAIVTKTLTIPLFNGVDLSGAHDIIIKQGPIQKVTATGHANIIDKLKTNVVGGVWESELRDDCYNHYELTIHVTVPDLSSVKISGSGNISVDDFDNQSNLAADITGSGNIDFKEFNGCQTFYAAIVGSGNISGISDFDDLVNLNIAIIGSGNFNGFTIETEVCNVTIEGSGNCYVYVENQLNINIAGSGSVYYKGYPVINATITGSGSVIDSN